MAYLGAAEHQGFIPVTEKMVAEKVFYSRFEGDSFYIESIYKKIYPAMKVGKIIYKMLDSPQSRSGSMEYVFYRIIDGKIYIYGNDGSVTRLTLLSAIPGRWILQEEEDIDGQDKRFGFEARGKKTFYLSKPKGYPDFDKCKPDNDTLQCFVNDPSH
jgi:hypothetical protein